MQQLDLLMPKSTIKIPNCCKAPTLTLSAKLGVASGRIASNRLEAPAQSSALNIAIIAADAAALKATEKKQEKRKQKVT